MKIGFVGLGRMGGNMVKRLIEKGHEIVGFDLYEEVVKELAESGMTPSYSIEEMVEKLPTPKIIWLMIIAGKPVDDTLEKLVPLLNAGDIIIEGGNSYFEDSLRRQKMVAKKRIHYLDVGVSGGMGGARHGACMMIGGSREVFDTVEILFKDMCTENGYGYMGKHGAGHFVKMVHNGIEYGMMGAIAEGMQAIENKKNDFDFDLKEVIKVYSNGSIIESKLMSWLQKAWEENDYLKLISGEVPKGETEEEMQKLEGLSEMKVLEQSRLMRMKTREEPSFAGKIIAALRNQFGGHKVNKSEGDLE